MREARKHADYDPAKAEAFAERFLSALNDGALCLMASIGHRTGLFDAMSGFPPSTADEIARAAGLNERYVREWLGAMATAGVVDPRGLRYALPAEHAAFLTRAAAADNMAVFSQYIPVLGGVEDDIVACFRNGGGVPYGKFPRFHAVMAEDSAQTVLSSLESHVLPLIDGLAERLGQGIRVLDIGCGSGRIMIRMAQRYPASRFVGIDLSEEATTAARTAAAESGLGNVEFIARDLSGFDEGAEEGAYDLVTAFDAIHDQARPLGVLRGVHRTLSAGGVFLMQDIRGSSNVHNNLGHPAGTFLYAVSTMHCLTVSLAQGGEGLGAMWGEEKARDYLHVAGFRSVRTHRLAHDFQNNWYVARK
jgi:2-polyprenyl-3-methyl-5-hydroxy-6-metoxy-1,4-benzoquinol methylase